MLQICFNVLHRAYWSHVPAELATLEALRLVSTADRLENPVNRDNQFSAKSVIIEATPPGVPVSQ